MSYAEMPSNSAVLRDRLSELLEEKQVSPRAASLAAGLSADAIRTVFSGRSRSPRGDTLARLARYFDVDVGYLLGITNKKRASDEPRAEEVVIPSQYPYEEGIVALRPRHEVAAGRWLASDETYQDVYSEVHFPVISHPLLSLSDQWLERVVGNSMNRFAPHGSLVQVLGAEAMGYAPTPGDMVVVERTRAQGGLRERSLKQVVSAADGTVQLVGRSHDPKYNVPLSLIEGVPEGHEQETTVRVVGRVYRVYVFWDAWREPSA